MGKPMQRPLKQPTLAFDQRQTANMNAKTGCFPLLHKTLK